MEKFEKNAKNSKSPVQRETRENSKSPIQGDPPPKKNVKNSKYPAQEKNRRKREKLKVSSTGGKIEKTPKTQSLHYKGKSLKNVKNSKSPIPVLREMLRKKTL